MSAFIVSDEHLNYLISFASIKGTSWWDGTQRQDFRGNEQLAFNKLYRANVDSVNMRYKENLPAMPSQYRFRNDTKTVQTLKACDCFDYQACEVSDYDSTEARRIIDAIRGAAIRALDGYEAAQWEISTPQPARA